MRGFLLSKPMGKFLGPKGFIRSILFFAIFMATAEAAPPPIRFGPEFTFTSSTGVVEEPEFSAYLERLDAHLIEGQPEGQKFMRHETSDFQSRLKDPCRVIVRYTSPNGWWFEVEEDTGVVEVKMKPLTVAEFRRYAGDIQDAIFASASNAGLFPWLFQGGGHINFGVEAFNGNLLLARNFVVDFYNHNELSMGIFNYDTHNALPFSFAQFEVVGEFKNLIKSVDRGSFKGGVQAFLGDVKKISYKISNEFTDAWDLGNSHWNLVDLDMGHANEANLEKRRVEIRSVRPQTNVDVWIRQIALIEGRIEFLRGIRNPIPLRPLVPVHSPLIVTWDVQPNHLADPPVDPQLALWAFYRYVNEAGEDWADHRGYLWPKWITQGELARFEATSEFQTRERRSTAKREARKRRRQAESCADALVNR